MKIFIMRHGEAEVIAASDEARHLTEYGRKQSISQGQWLKTHLNSTALSVQKVIVSPYVRAQETFELVNLALDNILNDVETWSGVTPYGNATLVADYLSVLQKQGVESVLLVSHLPLVGSIVSELYGKRNPISFYPSTIVQIDWNGEEGIIEACNSYKEHD
ncbi:phosphohistidine phosphatase SixA [uncultured Haemophilus sp.]|uniref:phosphohistidine phosphatase SixA n=1 Tax=uncultured Haemophilus sp. TaxID=237779 RepID=UPI002805AB01|nr:phosphohistidine phosphatase SixA [uncultured Haemophilus sp.]MDU6708243.1 phosphohistidine phosphatase SixA [Haemophilus parainfluenzae]